MATILKSYKYMNFFSSYHLKTYQSTSFLQCALKSHSTAAQINRKNSVVQNVFVPFKSQSELKILKSIKEKYFLHKYADHKDFKYLLENMYNVSKILTQTRRTLKDEDILTLIRCCGDKMSKDMPDVRLAILDTLWELLKTRGYKFNLYHYNALIEVYLENEKDFSPANILLEMFNNNIEPNACTYENLLTHYCRKGNVSEANKILHYFKENGIPVNEQIFSALIIGNAEANDMNGALEILNTMKLMGCIPSSKTYAALLNSYAKKGDIENIMETLQTCEMKDIIIEDGVKMEMIYHLAINGHIQHVEKILSSLSWNPSFANKFKKFFVMILYHKQIDVAFQIILAARKSNVCDKLLLKRYVLQFVYNIVTLDLPAEEIIKYLNLFEQMNVPAYEVALLRCFSTKNMHYSIPLFKAWQQTGAKIKEHFFWPVLMAHRFQIDGRFLETVKTMKDDFNIKFNEDTLMHFVIPFIKSFQPGGVFETLINDSKLSAEYIVNSFIDYHRSHNNVGIANKCIEACNDIYNVKFNTAKFIKKPSKVNQVMGNSYLKLYKNPLLHNVYLEYELGQYCKKGDISEATKYINRLQEINDCRLSFDIFLSYFDLLVKEDKMADAFQILSTFSQRYKGFHLNNEEFFLQYFNSLNLLAEKGSVDGVNMLFGILKEMNVRITSEILQPLITVHLLQNNHEEVLKVVKKIKNEYNQIILKDRIMEAFIKAEDVNCLQDFTDFCTEHNGHIDTILNLALAFLANNRMHQADKLLSSAGISVHGFKLRKVMHKFLVKKDLSIIKNFIEVVRRKTIVDCNALFEILLEKYSILNDWKEGLALLKQMEENNTVPSALFLDILTELLHRNNQHIPYSIPETKEQNNNDCAKIVNSFIEKNMYPDEDFKKLLINNLINAGDIKTIELIRERWHSFHQPLEDRYLNFEVYVKANKVNNYLENVNAAIRANNTIEIQDFCKSVNYKWLKFFLNHPEDFKLFKSLAKQLYMNQQLYINQQPIRPTLLVVSFYCYKYPEQSLEILNKYLPTLKRFSTFKFIIESFVYADRLDALSQFMQSIQQSNRIFYLYQAFFRTCEKYNLFEKELSIILKSLRNEKVEDEIKVDNSELRNSQVSL